MNLRVVVTGAVLIVLAAAFFLFMGSMAPRSNDPAEMMRTVGIVAGGGAGLGVAMIIFGLFRRKPARR
jgi:TRAP-type mannitol/chloroaromatic compound transport system permease large subunit